MVGIFTGLGAGFERGSGASLGGIGLLGGAGLGRNNEGVFVNAATGNLLVTQRDEFLIGRGPDAEIARTYNSFGALDENGDHWRQSTDRRVFGLTGTVNTAGSTVKRVSADGSEITYYWTGSYYQTTDGGGAHDRLTHSGGVWTWTDGDSQWTETYNAHGTNNWRIAEQSDISGNTLSFTYTGDRLTRVTTADGGYIEYSWSGNNITMMVTGYTNLVTSASQTLTRTRYGYDTQGRLSTVTVDMTPGDNAITDGAVYTTTYTYHGTTNRIATIGQTDGSQLAIAYDGQGRVTQLTQTVAGGDTRVTGFTYLAGETQVTDPRGQVTRLFYDGQGQLTGVTAPVPQTGGTAATVAFTYDGVGNLASMTDAAGAVTQYRYDAQGNVTYVRHPNGSTTLRVYDLANNMIQEIQTGATIALPGAGGNQAPVAATNAVTVTQQQGGSINLDVAALFSDPGDTLTYTVSGLPTGASFDGRFITGTFSSTGNYTITATASDGSLTASKSFTLSIVAVGNQAPVAAASVDPVTQAAGGSVTLDLSDLFDDPENDSLTYSATNIPPGMSLSGSVLSGAPAVEGAYTLTVYASDGQYTTQRTIVINVTASPGVAYTPVSWTLADYFDNPASSGITYGVAGQPPGLSVSGGVLSGTPAAGGHYTVTITATRSVTVTATEVSFSQPPPPSIPPGLPVTTGTGGNDQIVAGPGNGYYDGGGGWDILKVSGALEDYYFYAHSATEGLIVHKTTGQIIVAANFSVIHFLASDKQVGGYYLFGVQQGTSGADQIVGTGANELIEAGDGNDDIYSGQGNDHIDGGDGWDRINFWGEKSDYTFLRHPDGKISAIHNPSGKHDVFWNVEQFAFWSGPWDDQIGDLDITDVGYAAPAFTPSSPVVNPFNLDISDFFDDPSDGSIIYGASGLPPGVTVTNGVLTGAPASAGSYTITVTATKTATLAVNPVPLRPPMPAIPPGTPTVYGTSGYDYFVDTPGHHIYDGLGDWNMIQMPGLLGDYHYYLDPVTEDRIMLHKTSGEITVLRNVNGVSFAGDWTYRDDYFLFGLPNGTPDGDAIVGSDFNDYIEGGAGADFIYSGLGNDYIDGGAGDWDRVNFIGEKIDYTFLRHPDGKISAIHTPTGKHDVIWNVEYFAFNGGPWDDQVDDLGVTDVGYAAPAFVPGSFTNPVTGFSNVVFSGGPGSPPVAVFNAGAMTFPPQASTGVTVSGAHITAGLGDASALHTRYAYDSAGRMQYAVSGAGNVVEYRYNAAGQAEYQISYAGHVYSGGSAVPTLAQMDTWRNGLADRSTTQILQNQYDARGNLTASTQYGAATAAGAASNANGYRQSSYIYDQAGNLLSRLTGPDTVSETFVYDGLGRVIGSTDLAGGTTSIVFNDVATTTVVTTGAGHVVTSVYNKAGDLISQTDNGSDASSAAQTSYLYDKNGQVRRTSVRTGRTGGERTDHTYHLYDRAGRKVADIGHDGELTEYRYDTAGRVVATVRYNNALTTPQIASLADPGSEIELSTIRPAANGYDIWEWTVYNASSQVVATVFGDGSVTRYGYDQAGRLIATYGYQNKISVTGYINATSLGPTAVQAQPAAHANDTVTRTFYDADGRVRGVLNAEGHLSRIVYDGAGQKVEETVYAGATSAGLRASGTYQQLWDSVTKNAARDITSRYVYDGQGLLRFTIDALNRVTELVYAGPTAAHANGVVRRTIQYAGTLTGVTVYTLANLQTAVAAMASNPDNRSSWNIYNERGQLSYAVSAEGYVTGFTYDAGGRVVKTVQYAAARATPSLPTKATMDSWAASNAAGARVTRTYYSVRGEVLATVDAEGYVTRNWYDAQGRLWDSRRYANRVTATDAWTLANIDGASKGSDVLTRYRYDSRGNLVEVEAPDGTRSYFGHRINGTQAWEITAYIQGAEETRTFLAYDQAGRLTEKRYFTEAYVDVNTTAHVRELYTYDGFGNLVTATDLNEVVTAYTYDKLGRVLTETRAQGEAEAVTTVYEYDAFGQVVKVTDARGHASFSYYDQAGRVRHTIDAENYLTVTEYTVFGEVQSVTRRYNAVAGTPTIAALPTLPATHALDQTTTYAYDRLGRVLTITHLMESPSPDISESYTYNAFGNVVTHTNRLGGTITYQYDQLGRRTHETLPADVYTSAGGSPAATTITNTFGYDSRGNLTQKVEASGRPEARTTTYTYDAVGRVTKVSAGAFAYYADGTAASTTSGEVAESFVYDRRGNVIQKTDANGVRTQTWYDKLNRVTHQLVQQNATQGTLARTFYDNNGNVTEARVYETLTGMQANVTATPPSDPSGTWRTTTFTYDKLNRMLSSTVPQIRTAVVLLSLPPIPSNDVLSVTAGSLTTSYLYDAMGNVVRVTDPNGGQVHSYYDKLGRKIREVDQDRYLTYWEYDAQDNVTHERRYAQAVTGTVSTSSHGTVTASDPSTNAATALAQAHQDRITNYAYDRLGRKLSETRVGVLVFNGTNGFAVENAVVSFTYNGLGQVLTKREAVDGTGGATNTYVYDTIGRLTSESRKAFTDFNNNTVTPTVNYYYNGAGELVRQTEQGSTGVAARVTTYAYGVGGRLESVTDAELFTRTYRYDRGGRIVREEYTRTLGTTGSAQEAIVYGYDAQGRITEQYVTDREPSGAYTFDTDDQRSQTRYNAFGEVAERGINGIYAEQFRYDNAGRMWATSAGDGIWKYFLYDANGNQTVAITSSGMDIQDKSITWIMDRWGGNPDDISKVYIEGINATITIYDGRGLAVEIREPQREHSSTGTRETYRTQRQYNAFGEVTAETNALDATVNYKHNTMGRLIRTESPQVNVTSEAGVTTAQNPTEFYYYDQAGRLVASRDANGNLTRQTLLDGTGFGGTEALITQVTYADNGVVLTEYDIHGNARRVTDQLNRETTQAFDRMGRMIEIAHAGGLIETFVYDELGQQIRRYNNHYGSGVAETTLYDRQGRIDTHIAMGGDTTTYAYTWDGAISVAGFGPFGGWQKVTTYANTKTSTEREDQFGRMVSKSDLGGNASAYTYDAGGQLTARGGGLAINYTYYNTGKLASAITVQDTIFNVTQRSTTYSYDRAGNLLTEYLEESGNTIDWWTNTSTSYTRVLTDATATYDALGRMLTWLEAGNTLTPAAATSWLYDANGNIRSSTNTFRHLDAQGQVTGTPVTETYWYKFDTMNRVVVDKGVLDGGVIKASETGREINYDLAGQQAEVFTHEVRERIEDFGFGLIYTFLDYTINKEIYTYNASGLLTQVNLASDEISVLKGQPFVILPNPTGAGVRRASFTYDLMGRQTEQLDYNETGTTVLFEQRSSYNSKGQLTEQRSFTTRGSDIDESLNRYAYHGQTIITDTNEIAANYALGSATLIWTDNFKNSVLQGTSSTRNTYFWYDSASLNTTTHTPNIGQPGTTHTSTHFYSLIGGHAQITSVHIADGRSRTVSFNNDMNGQTIRRDERDNNNSTGDPHEIWYRFGGKEIGYTGNNDTRNTQYTTSISQRQYGPGTGPFLAGSPVSVPYAEFDPSTTRINSYSQGSSAGGYTVRAGDTLASVAANLWGDANLWYKLAQANGLTGEASLIEGQSLRIPAGVTKNTHNASTFKPYDPAEVIGDTAPTTPKPPKKNKCGVFGQILLVVVAVAVAFATQQYWLTAEMLKTAGFGVASGALSGAAAGAAGSIASQAVGVASGIQEKFSWNGVAMAAIGGGLGGAGKLGVGGTGIGSTAARAMVANIATQGIGMAVGAQSKFSWSSVAAAGVSAGVGAKVTKQLGNHFGGGKIGAAATTATVATASSIAHAATRSAIDGSNFGDNLRASIPDIIGQVIGSSITEELQRRLERQDLLSGAVARADAALLGVLDNYDVSIGADYSQVADAIVTSMGSEVMPTGESEIVLPSSSVTMPSSEAKRTLGTVRVALQGRIDSSRARAARLEANLTLDPDYGLSWQQIFYKYNPNTVTIRGTTAYFRASSVIGGGQQDDLFRNDDPWSWNPLKSARKAFGELIEDSSKHYDTDHMQNMLIGYNVDTLEFVDIMFPDGELNARAMNKGGKDFGLIAPISPDRVEIAMAVQDALGAGIIGGSIRMLGRSSVVKGVGISKGVPTKNLTFELKYVDRHVEGSLAANRMLSKGEAVHVFSSKVAASDIADAIIKHGEYTGMRGGFDRYGLRFDKPIGYRIDPSGTRIPLTYGQLKVRPDGFYHVIPRTGPGK